MSIYFVCGVPRTGTTMLYDTLCETGEFAYPSNWLNRFPRHDGQAVLNRITTQSLMQYANKNRDKSRLAAYAPRPVEAWNYLGELFPDFQLWMGLRKNDLDYVLRHFENDKVGKAVAERVVRRLNNLSRLTGKRDIVIKYTDLTRIHYLLSALPDARFIYIERELPPVFLSNYRQFFEYQKDRDWSEWIRKNQVGWPNEWVNIWKSEYGDLKSFVAFQTKVIERWNASEIERYKGDDRVVRLRYEDIMANPALEFGKIAKLTQLGIVKYVRERRDAGFFKNCNHKWLNHVTESEREAFERISKLS